MDYECGQNSFLLGVATTRTSSGDKDRSVTHLDRVWIISIFDHSTYIYIYSDENGHYETHSSIVYYRNCRRMMENIKEIHQNDLVNIVNDVCEPNNQTL